VRWLTSPYDQYETLCFGTALGYIVVWRQEGNGRFVEITGTRVGGGKEILDITVDTPMKDHMRFVVGARCGSVQLWKYDCHGSLTALKAVVIGRTIPRKVTFTSRANIIRVFGFYNGCM
jgi:hypothetical protein